MIKKDPYFRTFNPIHESGEVVNTEDTFWVRLYMEEGEEEDTLDKDQRRMGEASIVREPKGML